MTLTYAVIEEIPLDILKKTNKKKQVNSQEQKFHNHQNANGVNLHVKNKYWNKEEWFLLLKS